MACSRSESRRLLHLQIVARLPTAHEGAVEEDKDHAYVVVCAKLQYRLSHKMTPGASPVTWPSSLQSRLARAPRASRCAGIATVRLEVSHRVFHATVRWQRLSASGGAKVRKSDPGKVEAVEEDGLAA